MMHRVARILYRCRLFGIGFLIVTTIILSISIEIESDNSLRAWFAKNDPEYIAYENYIDTFESGKYLIIALKSKNLFSLDVLKYIRQKTEALESFEYVNRVSSLATANKIIGTPDSVEIHPLLSELELDNIQKIKNYTLKEKRFMQYLVSPDGKFTAIVVAFGDIPSEKEEVKAVRRIEAMLYRGKPENLAVFFSGDSKVMSIFNKLTKQTQKQVPILVISVICLCIFILFRSLYITFIIFLNIGMSISWSLGFYSILGYNFNAVTVLLIPLILVLSIADSIHIIQFFDEIKKDLNKKAAFIQTVEYIAIPCFLTSITTACGLLSLTVSRIDAVKHFGIGSAAGVMFAFLISIILVPCLLTLLPSRPINKRNKDWEFALFAIFDLSQKKPTSIFIAALLGLTLSFWGITKIRIETNRLEWFPKNGDFYKSAKIVEKNLFGIDNIEIMLTGPAEILKQAEILMRVDRIASEIEKLPRVIKVLSLTQYIKRIHMALQEDNPEFYKIPNDQFLIAQELLLFSLFDGGRRELDSFVTSDYSQGRISVKTQAMSSEQSLIMGKLLAKMAQKTFSDTGLQITLTGTIHLYNINLKRLVQSQIKSFTLAYVLIIGILFLAFWSIKYGGLSILPNLLPVTLIMGIMGWSGIALNNTTVMVASVALGIAVDDTVHYIARFRKERRSKKLTVQDALRKTTVSLGCAIIFTSMINITGFLILLVLAFQPTREFGLLISCAMFLALIGDLIILPASIKVFKGRSNLSTDG
jgi:predicted RND superfamily exporter protein